MSVYIDAVQAHLPQAALVFDRFHLSQHLSRAVDEVRRQTWRQLPGAEKAAFKRTRFLWLKNPANRARDERTRLSALLRLNSPIVKAYLLKEDLRRFWTYRSTAWAGGHLLQWLWRASHRRLEPFKKLARMLRAHLDGALIGHSRGGMLAWAIASRLQDAASHLILLGSPASAVVDMLRRPEPALDTGAVAAGFVVEAGQRALCLFDPDCTVPACGCPYPEDLRRPLSASTRVLAMYSRDDPIIAPAACQVPGARNIEVSGSHSGLAYNLAVYQELAAFLTPALSP